MGAIRALSFEETFIDVPGPNGGSWEDGEVNSPTSSPIGGCWGLVCLLPNFGERGISCIAGN